MPAFLHFYGGAVTVDQDLDMDHTDWQRMRAYMDAYQRQMAGR